MIKYELKNIATIDKLMDAHLRARKCKQYKNEIIKFEIDRFYNLKNLATALEKGTYKIKGYKRFMVYDPKEREIQALSYKDRVVQNCLCYNFFVPCYTKKLIYDNGACQKQKGTHFTRKRLEKFMTKFYKKYKNQGFFLRIDIKKYFNNIDHNILKQKLGKIHDKPLKDLVYHIIDSYSYSPNKGVPMGNQSSQVFALLYLNDIDKIIKEKYQVKYYVRYMDDLLILHNDKEFLKDLFAVLKQEVAKLNIETNKKSEIIPMRNGIEFLGVYYKFSPTGKIIKRIKNQSKRRMIKRIKELKNNFEKGIIDKVVIKQSLAGFKGNIKRLTVNGLKVKHIQPLKALISKKKTTGQSKQQTHSAKAGKLS